MNKRNKFVTIGILIYIVSSVISRFILKIPDYIYVPIALIAIVLIFIGLIKERKNKFKN